MRTSADAFRPTPPVVCGRCEGADTGDASPPFDTTLGMRWGATTLGMRWGAPLPSVVSRCGLAQVPCRGAEPRRTAALGLIGAIALKDLTVSFGPVTGLPSGTVTLHAPGSCSLLPNRFRCISGFSKLCNALGSLASTLPTLSMCSPAPVLILPIEFTDVTVLARPADDALHELSESEDT